MQYFITSAFSKQDSKVAIKLQYTTILFRKCTSYRHVMEYSDICKSAKWPFFIDSVICLVELSFLLGFHFKANRMHPLYCILRTAQVKV